MCPGTGRDSHSWDRIDSLEMVSVCVYTTEDRFQIRVKKTGWFHNWFFIWKKMLYI